MRKFVILMLFVVALIVAVFIGIRIAGSPLGFFFNYFGRSAQEEISDTVKEKLAELITTESNPLPILERPEVDGTGPVPLIEGELCVYRSNPGPTGDIDIFDEIPQSWLDKTLTDREIDEPQPNEDYFLLLDPEPGYGDDEFWLFVVHFKAVSPRIMLEKGWVRVTNLEAIASRCGLSDLTEPATPDMPVTGEDPEAEETPETPVSKAKEDVQGIASEAESCVYRAIPGITGDIDIFDEVPQGLLDKMRFDREIDEPQPDEDYFLLLEPTPGFGDDEYWLYVNHFKIFNPQVMLEKGWVRVTNLEAIASRCGLSDLTEPATPDMPVTGEDPEAEETPETPVSKAKEDVQGIASEAESCVYRAIPGITGDIDIFDEVPQGLLDKMRFDREIDEPQPDEDYFLLLEPTPGFGDDEYWLYVNHFKIFNPQVMLEKGWVRVTNLEALTPECELPELSDSARPESTESSVNATSSGNVADPEPTKALGIPQLTVDPVTKEDEIISKFEEGPCIFRANPGQTGDIDIFDEIPGSLLDKMRFDREIDELQPDEDYFLLLDPTPGFGDDEYWLYVDYFKGSSPNTMLDKGWVRATNLDATTAGCKLPELLNLAAPTRTPLVPTSTRTPLVPTSTRTPAVTEAREGNPVSATEREPCIYRAIPGGTGDIDIFDKIPQSWLDKTRFDREIDEPQPNEDYFLLLDPTPGYGDDEYWLYVSHFKANNPNTMLDKGWVRATNLEATTSACELSTLR